jgi:adenine-specific DNA methylase
MEEPSKKDEKFLQRWEERRKKKWLFWFEGEDISSAKLNECFNMVLGDFQRLQKDKDFNDFTIGKKVKIQIFDNSGSDIPLIEKII